MALIIFISSWRWALLPLFNYYTRSLWAESKRISGNPAFKTNTTHTYPRIKYIHQPEGFVVPGKEQLVGILVKCIYGLKQSPWVWNCKFNCLLKFGFIQSRHDPCVFPRVPERKRFWTSWSGSTTASCAAKARQQSPKSWPSLANILKWGNCQQTTLLDSRFKESREKRLFANQVGIEKF